MFIIYIIIYNIIIYIVQPVIWIKLLWRSRRNPSYRRRWLERYGFHNNNYIKPNGIILHAVSLGEMFSSIPLVYALQKRYPNIVITLTSMTLTGMELAESRFVNCNVYCRYFPYDLFGAMNRFINQVQPKLVIVMETELWPNFINILYKRNIPFIIVNARISLRSFIKYKKISYFIALIMNKITLIAAQNKENASRFFELGCEKSKLFVTGNLKFDVEVTQDLLKKVMYLKSIWAKGRKIWIAGSTHAGEEILLLQAHKQLLQIFPNLLMILAPRHPNRFINVQSIIKKFGLSCILKSSGVVPTQKVQVVINDTIGELMLLYGISDIAFVGGSLVKHGGHNPLEPAMYAIPILMGPYTFNFSDICSKLYESGGLITVTDIVSLVNEMTMLLQDQKSRVNYGNNAITTLRSNQGTLQKLLYLLDKKIF